MAFVCFPPAFPASICCFFSAVLHKPNLRDDAFSGAQKAPVTYGTLLGVTHNDDNQPQNLK